MKFNTRTDAQSFIKEKRGLGHVINVKLNQSKNDLVDAINEQFFKPSHKKAMSKVQELAFNKMNKKYKKSHKKLMADVFDEAIDKHNKKYKKAHKNLMADTLNTLKNKTSSSRKTQQYYATFAITFRYSATNDMREVEIYGWANLEQADIIETMRRE